MKILVLPGDGIGKEVTASAIEVLTALVPDVEIENGLIGGSAYDETGFPLPEATIKKIKTSDAVLLGAVGGNKWDKLDHTLRPEAGLLKLRAYMQVFANLRPVKVFKPLMSASTIKEEVIEGVDLMIVRELTGGLYFGKPKGIETKGKIKRGFNTLEYTTPEIERVAKIAFDLAQKRNKKLTSVDKANVLESSRLWRETVEAVAKSYPDVELSHMYVDNCAMQLIRNPKQFDVILTENMFGDILSDEASMITGSLGMLPSGSLGQGKGLYEPVHGSAPDIAGTGKANPIGAILSAAMMLKYSFNRTDEACCIEQAVEQVLSRGIRTSDMAEGAKEVVGTEAMTRHIIDEVKRK